MILRSDGTWAFVEVVRPRLVGTSQYVKSPRATSKRAADFGKFALWFDPQVWKEASSSQGRVMLQNSNGKGYAIFVSEGLGVPTDSLKDVMLFNARKADPNMQLVSEGKRTVNGREVLCLEMEGNVKGLPFRFYGYYYGGSSGNVQVVTYTLQSAFAANKDQFTDLLNGLEISDDPLPPSPAAPPEPAVKELTFNDGKIAISYNTSTWGTPKTDDEGKVTLNHKKGAGFAFIIPEKLQIATEALSEIALENAKEADPEAKIVFREKRNVNGLEVLCLKMSVTPVKGLPLTYYGYYYGGRAGTIQVLTATSLDLLTEYEKDFTELLNTLKVR